MYSFLRIQFHDLELVPRLPDSSHQYPTSGNSTPYHIRVGKVANICTDIVKESLYASIYDIEHNFNVI